MDFDHARKIAEKLENNLKILQNAAEFVQDTHEREGTYGNDTTRGVFSSLKQALIVYIECDGDKEKLEKVIKDLEEIAMNPPERYGFKTRLGHTLIELVNSHLYLSEDKYLDYNVEADRILKEIDAQVNVLCKEFSIDQISSRLSSQYLTSDYWDIKEVEQAFNVAKAVKSLTD